MRIRTLTGRFTSISLACISTCSIHIASMAQSRELNPVVVSATRFEMPLADVLPSASVITREQIDSSQATTLADLLQGQAGFEFGRNGGPGTVTSFFLRGQDSTNMVLLIDGVRVQTDSIGSLTLTEGTATDDLAPDAQGLMSHASPLRAEPVGFAHIGLPVRPRRSWVSTRALATEGVVPTDDASPRTIDAKSPTGSASRGARSSRRRPASPSRPTWPAAGNLLRP